MAFPNQSEIASWWPDELVKKSPKTWPNPFLVKYTTKFLPRKKAAQKYGFKFRVP
jgi:hypothetical protein